MVNRPDKLISNRLKRSTLAAKPVINERIRQVPVSVLGDIETSFGAIYRILSRQT